MIMDSVFTYWTMTLTLAVTIIPLVVAVVVFFVQNMSKRRAMYKDCVNSLYSENSIEQTSAAILLRDFINKWGYKSNTKNLIIALLRLPIPISLRKTLADGLSYAKSLKGQDMQWVIMFGALIKPESRIKYESCGKSKYKQSRISMELTDCFHANLQGCNITNVYARKTIFYCANLMGTSFRNSLFYDANFKCANLKGVTFDEDCVLDGAIFEDAVGLSEAFVKVREGFVISKYPLSDFLDSNAVFHSFRPKEKYMNKKDEVRIFVSKLGAMDSKQTLRYNSVINVIETIFNGNNLDHIERDQYPLVAQLTDVMTHMEKCDGCVIFAFEYLKVQDGYIHKDIVGKDYKQLNDIVLASPWLHIEAALANSNEIPCLIIYDQDLLRDGMFDEKIVNPDLNLYAMEYSDNIQIDNAVIEKWRSRVQEYHYKHHYQK